jgi:AcrR family transcriptional regulator
MAGARESVELVAKNRPRQERAKRTYENILRSAAELLVEVGVERISTNLIAERAGITVPALYRYFPNKYSVLHALGAALMDRQNAVFADWFDQFSSDAVAEELLAGVDDLLYRTCEVSREQPGGLEILQTLRAVEPLRKLRLDSHERVAQQFGAQVARLLGWDLDDSLLRAARMSIEVGYAVVEMAIEGGAGSEADVVSEGARMIQLYWRGILASR